MIPGATRRKKLEQNCELCGLSCSSLLVHHLKPVSMGGSDAIENLQTLCPECHNKVHKGLHLPHKPFSIGIGNQKVYRNDLKTISKLSKNRFEVVGENSLRGLEKMGLTEGAIRNIKRVKEDEAF